MSLTLSTERVQLFTSPGSTPLFLNVYGLQANWVLRSSNQEDGGAD
ncbi:hypothetical protein VB005_02158 [Metarhizium brunneum]